MSHAPDHEVSCLVTYVQLVKMIVKLKVTAYAVLATLIRLFSLTRFNSKTMPTDSNYSCHIKVVELV